MKVQHQTKAKCSQCREMAIWCFTPGGRRENDYYCDACVARGCSCNWNDDLEEENKDDLGRLLPCCEYSYDEEGFDEEDK
jgi:hypothetical protein